MSRKSGPKGTGTRTVVVTRQYVLETKNCAHCGREFEGTKAARYCGRDCSSAADYRRHAERRRAQRVERYRRRLGVVNPGQGTGDRA